MNSDVRAAELSSPRRVAIVDDDRPMLRLLGLWATKIGFDPVLIGSGQDFLQANLDGVVLVCLDLNLGDIHGLDVIRHIHARDTHLPVIVITAERQVDTAVEAMRMGALDYLTKPLEMHRFNQALRNAIESRTKQPRTLNTAQSMAALRAQATNTALLESIPHPPITRSFTWMEIEISRAGNEVRVSARGSRSEQTGLVTLPMSIEAIKKFAADIRVSAKGRKPMSPELVETAQLLSRSVLAPQIETLRARLAEAAGGRLLVRFAINGSELQAVPWEALCKDEQSLGFWASSPDILPVRGVFSSAPWSPSPVQGALNILAIAPEGDAGIVSLATALSRRIEAGEIQWLEPLVGRHATADYIFDRLRREPVPHVVHFIGHGGQERRSPMLRLADDSDGEECWLPVELLAQQLEANLKGYLRLIVLEACEGAHPGVFASAAEILARAGVTAVVAHLWPVRADVARVFSAQFYRALAGADCGRADVAVAMNEARRMILSAFEATAQAFSPVVYLRGPDGVIFDFNERQVVAPPRVKLNPDPMTYLTPTKTETNEERPAPASSMNPIIQEQPPTSTKTVNDFVKTNEPAHLPARAKKNTPVSGTPWTLLATKQTGSK